MIFLIPRILVGLIFLTSGIAKMWNPRAFSQSLERYGLVRKDRLRVVSVAITWFEALLGAVLVMGLFQLQAALLCEALLGIFTASVAITLRRGKTNIACGCMLTGKQSRIGWHICFRNLALQLVLIPNIFRVSPYPWFLLALAAVTGAAVQLNQGKGRRSEQIVKASSALRPEVL